MSQESKERVKAAAEREFVNSLRGENLSPDEIRQKLEEFSATLKVRPLDYEAYAKMPYAEKSFHEFANSAELDKALTKYKHEQRKAAEKSESDIKLKWKSNATAEDFAAAQKAGEDFLSRYRHFIRDSANSAAMSDRMQLKNRNPQEINSWIRTFEELAVEGLVFLNARVAGISEDTVVGGHELRTHKELYRFLKPTPTAAQIEQHAASKMSADEWKKSRPELQDGIPFAIQQQFFKAAHSLAYFEPQYIFNEENNGKILAELKRSHGQFNLSGLRAAFRELKKRGELELKSISASGQIITHTEFEPRETGQPEAPGKLRAKVARMSSTEMATFLRENPSARKAIDSV